MRLLRSGFSRVSHTAWNACKPMLSGVGDGVGWSAVVAGVAALIMSQGTRSRGSVAAKINNTADSIACPPDLSIYDFFPAVDNGAPQVCQGGTGYNSFNGHGQVNALRAVSK